jgi:hypothetical protein
MQREAVHRRSGVFARLAQSNAEFVTIPGLQRIITLRFMLRGARETSLFSYAHRRSSAGDLTIWIGAAIC